MYILNNRLVNKSHDQFSSLLFVQCTDQTETIPTLCHKYAITFFEEMLFSYCFSSIEDIFSPKIMLC